MGRPKVTLVPIVCKYHRCGKTKWVRPCEAITSRTKKPREFCSDPCSRNYLSDPESPGYTKIILVCDNCGIEYPQKPAYAKRDGFHTCSRLCRVEYLKKIGNYKYGEKNQFYNGGKRKIRDQIQHNKMIPIVMEIFGERSPLSGEIHTSSYPLEVHHIDYNENNNDIDNLIPLTLKEHGRTKSKAWRDICRNQFEEMMLKWLNFREFYSDSIYLYFLLDLPATDRAMATA